MSTDYSNKKKAPVVICFVRNGDRFLLLKRSDKVLAYKNKWASVAGFLDDSKTPDEKAIEEITEELGLKRSDIASVKIGPVYAFVDPALDREWERHLVLVEVTTTDVRLDWEHVEYKWLRPKEIANYDTTPGFLADLEKVRNL